MAPQNAEAQRSLVDYIFGEFSDYTPAQSALIPMLQRIQASEGYLPAASLTRVAELLRVPPSHVYGVATFYHQFRFRPKGEHLITVCRGTACHVKGSQDTINYLNQQLGIVAPYDTSPDLVFTVQQVRCLGACALAPVIKVDDTIFGRVNHAKIRGILRVVRNGGRPE